jgi:hypothetical protein
MDNLKSATIWCFMTDHSCCHTTAGRSSMPGALCGLTANMALCTSVSVIGSIFSSSCTSISSSFVSSSETSGRGLKNSPNRAFAMSGPLETGPAADRRHGILEKADPSLGACSSYGVWATLSSLYLRKSRRGGPDPTMEHRDLRLKHTLHRRAIPNYLLISGLACVQ